MQILKKTESINWAIEALDDMPEIGRKSAERILAETGVEMEHFQNESRFSSWAGLVPECKESAGKKMSTRIRKGNKYLKATLVECARAGIRNKQSYKKKKKKSRPVGSDQEIDVDFRVISASHQDLDLLVRQGKFRQDLFFRIHVMDLILPPLRERGEDVLLLANHFIQKICMEWETPPKQLTEAAETYLLQQHFPGNVRELRNMIERAITLSEDTTIDVSHLHPAPLRANISNPFASAAQSIQTTVAAPQVVKKLPSEGLERYLENIEKDILLNALNMTHWNRTLAAKKLGMTFRSLRYRLKKFGLDTETEQEV